MPDQTEAACLLEAGTSYRKRILFHPQSGGDVFLGVKVGGYSLYRGDEPIYHFDFEGRWQRSFVEGVHYLKGLDTSIRSVDRVRVAEDLVLRRRTLRAAEAEALDSRIRADIANLIRAIEADDCVVSDRKHGATPLSIGEARDLLIRAVGWDAPAWQVDQARHLSTYGPLPFIPPTCPNPLILQGGLGGGFGRGAGPEFRRRTPGEFLEHAQGVRKLVGRRLAGCRDLFLDGLDPIGRSPEEVFEIVETALGIFPLAPPSARSAGIDEESCPLGSIQAMLDDFPKARPDRSFWARLRSLGVEHLTLGIESGDPIIRSAHGKSWSNSDVAPLVEDLQVAGISTGLVILAGAGGVEGARSHVEATGALIESLSPAKSRKIYLVDPRSLDRGPAPGVGLSDAEMRQQTLLLKSRLSMGSGEGRPTVIAYNADKQST